MKKGAVETAVGVFVLIGIVCIGYLTVRLGRMDIFGGGHYVLEARFQSITGLKKGSTVEMAGVPIGKVEDIGLDPDRLIARVRLRIREDIRLSDDTIASVKTAGLIGDKFIKITPGGSDIMLEDGEMITETESALDIEELISKYVFGDV
ncbi:MAG: outer membrane lipid asymmetry maintenance protein MlaD [Desulfobacterales bacterium]